MKSTENVRSKIFDEFAQHNLFLLETKDLLHQLLWPLDKSKENLLIQNFTSQLLNAIVSTRNGCAYFSKTSVIDTLIADSVDNSSIEINTADNLLATIAKLSANDFQRNEFIDKG